MAPRLRRPMLCLHQQIPMQSLLHKMTSCLMQPATTFFVSQIKKKPVQNNHYKTLPNEEMGNKHKATFLKLYKIG